MSGVTGHFRSETPIKAQQFHQLQRHDWISIPCLLINLKVPPISSHSLIIIVTIMSNLARGMASYYDQALALFNAGNNHQAKELCLVIVNHAWSPRLTKALAWQLLSEMPDWGYQSRKWALTNAEAVIRQFTEDNPEDAKLKQDLLAHNVRSFLNPLLLYFLPSVCLQLL